LRRLVRFWPLVHATDAELDQVGVFPSETARELCGAESRRHVVGNEGHLEEARRLLLNSLDYLSREPFPETEIRTRQALLQLFEILDEPPERSFEIAARPLTGSGRT
jgi:hypothetical protein